MSAFFLQGNIMFSEIKKETIVIFVIFVIVVGIIFYGIDSFNRKEINKYVQSHNGEVEQIEERSLLFGPFYVKLKHQRIYRIQLKDGRVLWVRTGSVFGNEWIWEKD